MAQLARGSTLYPLTSPPLNERERARNEAQDKRDRDEAAALSDMGITPSEASLFNVLHYGLTVPPPDLCRRAAYRDYSVGGPVSVAENSAALASCLSKNWLQIVDEAVLDRLQLEIRQAGILGPIYDYPNLGGVDFTHAGAEQWFRICERLWNGGRHESSAYCDIVHRKSAHYFSSQSKAVSERDRWKGYDSIVSVTEPSPIGPWRANWWRRFPEGYRIDVEERMQWKGRASGGEGFVFLYLGELPFDLSHASDVLDRYNVAWAEWIVLASVEQRNDRHGIVRRAAEISKQFGKNLAASECLGGIETCLINGWLRRVDEQFTTEIRRLLRADPVFMPVPFDLERHSVEMDYSVDGAHHYRMLSAEIFGIDWEDSLRVEEGYFREEHRYCATEAGLEAVEEQCANSNETPKSRRVEAIGPWCVYWWQLYPEGYRLELTFGEE
jgi:hypothetical protein